MLARFGALTGLGGKSDPMGRRLAVGVAAVVASVAAVWFLLELPVTFDQERTFALATRTALPHWAVRAELLVAYLLPAVAYLVVIPLAVRRFGAPRSVWVPLAVGLAAGIA